MYIVVIINSEYSCLFTTSLCRLWPYQ